MIQKTGLLFILFLITTTGCTSELPTKPLKQNAENQLTSSSATETVYRVKSKPKSKKKSKSGSGSLDKSFGHDGMVVTDFDTVPPHTNVVATGITMTGKVMLDDTIIAVGKTVGINPAISLVASYGKNGKLNKKLNALGYETRPQITLNAVTITPYLCGGILTAGQALGQFHVSSTGSSCHLGFRNDAALIFPGSTSSQAYAFALDSQLRIVLGGYAVTSTPNNTSQHFALARTTPNGFSDPTFGNGGFVQTNFNNTPNNFEQINGLAIDADNKIVVVGQAVMNTEQRFVLARYTETGVLDTTFGEPVNKNRPNGQRTGKIVTDFSPLTGTINRNDSAQGVVIQPDGKIIAAGYALNTDGTFLCALARYTSDGTLDTSFGAPASQANFNGLSAGMSSFGAPASQTNFNDLRTGMVVSSFGAVSTKANAIALQKNGGIVIAGSAIASLSQDSKYVAQQFLVARYLNDGINDGTVDIHFGDNGKTETKFEEQGAVAQAITLDNNDDILLAGYSFTADGIAHFSLARYHG